MYSHLCNHEVGLPYKVVWKTKLPLKIKKFMWLVYQGAILTQDNLLRRKGRVALSVLSVMKRRVSNTFSLVAL